MAKKGITPSQIGVILRDSHGVAQGFQVSLHFGVKLHLRAFGSLLQDIHIIPRVHRHSSMSAVFAGINLNL